MRWQIGYGDPMTGHAGETGNCLYAGHVMHMRLAPFGHKFRYRIFSMLLDIDQLEQTCAGLRLLGLDRFAPLSFHRKDHGPRDGSDLRPWVEELLAAKGLPRPHRIRLLSFPRILGYVFNPLSVYYCEDADGHLQSVVYEVKNTFGDQHPYVVPIAETPDGAHRHRQEKGFYVSPFIGQAETYNFTIRPPAERLALKIRQETLIATWSGTRRPLTDGQLLRLWAAHPLMTVKVMAAIHWQALRLALKGARFRPYRGPYPTGAATEPSFRQRFLAMMGWKPKEISD